MEPIDISIKWPFKWCLVGSSGSGKTNFALQIVRQANSRLTVGTPTSAFKVLNFSFNSFIWNRFPGTLFKIIGYLNLWCVISSFLFANGKKFKIFFWFDPYNECWMKLASTKTRFGKFTWLKNQALSIKTYCHFVLIDTKMPLISGMEYQLCHLESHST